MNRIFSKSILGIACLFMLFTCCKKPDEVVIHEDKDEFDFEEQQNIGENLSLLISTHSDNLNILDRSTNQAFYNYADQILASIVNTQLVETRNVFNWELIILEDDDLRSAFTIPGGKIYIYTGLLKMISSENEFFSVLAHELCYGDRGSIIDAMKQEYDSELISDLELGTTSQHTIDIAKSIHNISYNESMVARADSFTLEMICPFQYKADGLKSLIERAMDSSGEVPWLSNRPRTQEALDIIESNAEGCGVEELTFTERYTSYKNMLP